MSDGNLIKVANKLIEQLDRLNANLERQNGVQFENEADGTTRKRSSYNNGYRNSDGKK